MNGTMTVKINDREVSISLDCICYEEALTIIMREFGIVEESEQVAFITNNFAKMKDHFRY